MRDVRRSLKEGLKCKFTTLGMHPLGSKIVLETYFRDKKICPIHRYCVCL